MLYVLLLVFDHILFKEQNSRLKHVKDYCVDTVVVVVVVVVVVAISFVNSIVYYS